MCSWFSGFVAVDDLVEPFGGSFHQALHRHPHALLCEPAHGEQALLQLAEFFLEVGHHWLGRLTRHRGLPRCG